MAYGMLLNVMWQPGWEGSLGENGYMYMYDWDSAVHLKLSQHCSSAIPQNKIKKCLFVCLFLIVLERTAWKERSRTKLSGKTTHGRGKEEAPHKRALGAAETYFCPGYRSSALAFQELSQAPSEFHIEFGNHLVPHCIFFFPFSLSLCYKNFNSLTLTEPQGQEQKERVL